jgi:hypothetical protein
VIEKDNRKLEKDNCYFLSLLKALPVLRFKASLQDVIVVNERLT